MDSIRPAALDRNLSGKTFKIHHGHILLLIAQIRTGG